MTIKNRFSTVLIVLTALIAVSIPVAVFAVSGETPSSYLYGDITGDGTVDTKDLTRLMKYIAGEKVDVFGSDLTGDGNTNAKDLTRLMKVLAGDYKTESSVPSETSGLVTDTPNTDEEPAEPNLSDYTPAYKLLAFREGALYCFSGLRGFNGHIPVETSNGAVMADSEMLADMLGFTHSYSAESRTLVLTYGEKTKLSFDLESGKLSLDGHELEYPPDTFINREGRLLCSANYFADLLGYTVLTENGITYLATDKRIVTAAKKQEAEERFELYETVVLNTDDVEADQRGVGIYEKAAYDDRVVGIAYSTWHDSFTGWNSENWGLPLDGPYLSNDREVIRRHGEMFAEAGIDFVFVDWSNNTDYNGNINYIAGFDMIEKSVAIMFEEWSKIENAPKICIFAGPGHNGPASVTSGAHQRKVDQVWHDYVTNPEYADMYYYHDGKPLLICYAATPTLYGSYPETNYWNDDRFTVRWMSGYVGQQGKLRESSQTLKSRSHWSWEEREAQTFTVLNGAVECITCSAATRAQGTEGSSGYIPAYTRDNGATLKKQFQRANDLGAGIVLLTTWNEWLASEQFSAEQSKDLEPSQAHGTFYYDLMCRQIMKFKGAFAESES